MHETFMRRAISLAECGRGHTAPNPLVGAVLVRDGKIIGEGFHAFYGGLHAERAALEDCLQRGLSPAGASLYVTLEPCCHTGKQPPCTEAILAAGIRAVFVGSSDPNPLVAGKGIAALRQGGVAVTEHVSESACDALNAPFFSPHQNRPPLCPSEICDDTRRQNRLCLRRLPLDYRRGRAGGGSPDPRCGRRRDGRHQYRAAR